MKTLRVLSAVILVLGFSVVANAQATRTWVSGVGDDANPCSRTAPCKTFAGAISKTANCGEISVLDPGGFGAVTIVKSIVINGRGTLAGILAAGVTGVIINGAGISVTLKDIDINGACSGIHGVRIINAATVNIQGCNIYNFGTAGTSRGVNIENGASINVSVRIDDTSLFNNAFFGVSSEPTGGGTVKLTLNNVRVVATGQSAVHIKNDTKATIARSTLNENGGAGIFAEQTSADVNVYNSTMSNNTFGLFVGNGGNPTVRLFASQITDNSTDGIHLVTGNVLTHQNNAIQNNAGSQATTGNLSTQ
jgi:hypothetical protein